MTKRSKKQRQALFTFFGLGMVVAGIVLLFAIQPLYNTNLDVIFPKGIVGIKERNLLILSTILMLIVVIPVFMFTPFFIWRYRSDNKKADYDPEWDYDLMAESIWWGLPCIVIFVLAIYTWIGTHELDPFQPIESDKKPMTIQVVALQWKWLFIYPEENIATLNFVQFPEKTPIRFEITGDAPMNSFWIPSLGGQVYAMPKMKTYLNLIANEEGVFRGSSANISGEGFSDMVFRAKASSETAFKEWVASAQQSKNALDQHEYDQLALPSQNNPIKIYTLKDSNLFESIVMKYMTPRK